MKLRLSTDRYAKTSWTSENPSRQAQRGKTGGPVEIRLGGTSFIADQSGALWHERERTLLVADLHFEKASRYASRGQFLPPYDTAATLMRLASAITRHRPQRLICLGDSFHDVKALERMAECDAAAISALAAALDLIWISGNHDPEMPAALPGKRMAHLNLNGVHLCHEPRQSLGPETGEICGHLHPAARVATPRGSIRRRCFASNGVRLVMPAFGSLTGGLNVRDAAFEAVFGANPMRAYVLGRENIYEIGERHLFHD